MKKSYIFSIVLLFLAYISLFFVLNFLVLDKDFSERENRYLQQAPKFSFLALFSGDFTEDFEDYTTDQFAFRDHWVTLKAVCERLIGKQENKSVFYGSDGYLMEAFTAPDEKVLAENISFIQSLADSVDVPVSFALIPGAVELQKVYLPENAPTDSQKALIDEAYSLFDGQTVDVYGSLSAHDTEYIFYRTDHHWTSLGAYYGFQALGDAWGLPCPSLSSYERETVSEDFYGTTYSSSGFSWVPPDSMELFVPEDGVVVTTYANGQPEEAEMYEEDFLQRKDKYSLFFGGNTPRLEIETKAEGERLLVIRDSYADSLAPFLTESFSHITMLDMRYFKGSVQQFIAENGYDRVLVIYSVENFCEDNNLFLMSF